MLNKVSPPAFHPIENINIISPDSYDLTNGAKLFAFSAGEQDLVRIQWVFNNKGFQSDKPIRHAALSANLIEGTTKHSSAVIAESIDYYGAFLYPEFSYDHTSLSLITISKHLDRVLPIVIDILNDATFPQQEIDTYRRNAKQGLKISLKKNDVVARRELNHALFGKSIYGFKAEEEDYDRLQREDLISLFREKIVPANCTAFLSGKVAGHITDSFVQALETSWYVRDDFSSNDLGIVAPDASDQVIIQREKALQTAVRLGNLSIGRNHEDFPSLQVVNTLLGGFFGSRLMANIREDKGYTYGIGSHLVSLKKAAYWVVATEVGAEFTSRTLKEIEYEINRLKEEMVSEEELTLVKNYLLGSLLGSVNDVFSHADKFRQVYYSGLSLDYYDYYTQQVNRMTPDDVQRLANTYLDFDKMTKVLVGKI